MNRLLIVEDEKMIRKGLKAIAQRAPIEIKEILECKNGLEALEILQNTCIDVVFTDIRMPKMDGLTLVKEIQKLPYKPQIVMISGYDDFNYAVEALRCGAKEYILKPVERENISNILVKLEALIQEKNRETQKEATIKEIGDQQLKYMLLNPNITLEEISKIKEAIGGFFEDEAYLVCCTNEVNLEALEKGMIQLTPIENNTLFIIKESHRKVFIETYLKPYYVGISKAHSTLDHFKDAYLEALEARKYAYLTASQVVDYKNVHYKVYEKIEETTIDKIVQLLGTNKLEVVNVFIDELFDKVLKGEIEDDIFEAIISQILKKIRSVYKSIIATQEKDYTYLEKPYQYDTAKMYQQALLKSLEEVNTKVLIEHEDYRNKGKIQDAMVYIQSNYDKELNMAVVSNHISMNYSFFSLMFKEYTGMKFVNYLKEVRINKAKALLTTTDEKIAEIGLMVGYENEKHFMKVFKSVLGVSPTEYRKNASINELKKYKTKATSI